MTGFLKRIGDKFTVEYGDSGVYVRWRPGDASNAEKPAQWVNDAFPRQEQVPENMLRSLIGTEARFEDSVRFEERKAELRGKLDDGGTITIGYVKGIPPQILSESDRTDAAETLRQRAHSYLRSDIWPAPIASS